MTQVIRQVVAEIRAKTDQLDRELALAEGKLKKTRAQVEGVGGAGAEMGTKWEMGARQIAMATETISRAGKVSGEAGKRIISVASSMALGFGAGGAAIGALGIFGLAVTQTFSRAREEARLTAEAFDKTLRTLQRGRDARGVNDLLSGLIGGDALSDDPLRRRGIAGLEADLQAMIAKRRRDLPGGGYEVAFTRGEQVQADAIRATLATMREEYARAVPLAVSLNEQEQRRLSAEQAITDAKKEQKDLGKELEQQAKESAEFAERFAAFVSDAVASETDRIVARYQPLIDQARSLAAQGRDSETNLQRAVQLEDLRDAALAAARELQKVEALVSGLKTAAAQGVSPAVDDFLALNTRIASTRAEMARFAEGSPDYNRLKAGLEELVALQAKLLGGVMNVGTGSGPSIPDAMSATALRIQQAADGALQLAANLGLAGREGVDLLRAVGQIAGNLPALQQGIKSGSTLGIIGAALPILGAISGLFGDSPAEKQRREEIRKNTDAIRELTKQTGFLGGIGVSGAAASSATGGLQGFLRRMGGVGGIVPARSAAAAFGLDLGELDRIAAEYGITLNESIESFRQLYRVLGDTIGRLGEFGTDLDSRRRQAAARAQVFGIRDPLELLGLTRGTYGGASPALDDALAGLDLSTAEGRALARRNLQELFAILEAGGPALDAAGLGNLTGDELLQAILELIAGLNDVDESLGLNTSTVTKGDRVITADRTQITADQASRLLGVATSQLAELRLIREALAGARDGLPLPDLPRGYGGGAGGTTTITITQHFHGVQNRREIADAVTDSTLDAIDRGLGRRARIRTLHEGQAVRA